MLKLLVPIDGSQHSDRAVDYAIQRARRTRDGACVELLNVQLPMTGVNVKMFISQENLESYYRDEAMTVLQPALHRLREAGIPVEHHIGVGDPGRVTVDYAIGKQIDEIIIGSRGRGVLSGALLGSVAQKVIHLSPVPVVVIT
jgi:nucleotide-binding universal stress UspA family protein